MSLDRSVENVKRLTFIHLRRYGHQLRCALDGLPGYDPDENARLFMIWENIRDAGFRYELVGPDAQVEIDDAIEAGE